jgi:hypothetical protein
MRAEVFQPGRSFTAQSRILLTPKSRITSPLKGRVRYVRGRVQLKPLATAYEELHRLSRVEDIKTHRYREALLLGQFAASSNLWVRDAFGQLLAYAKGARTMRGLESLFLTGLHSTWLSNDKLMFNNGVVTWSLVKELSYSIEFRPADKGARNPITFFDRENCLVTVVTAARWDRIEDSILHGVLGESGVASGLRQSGPGLASDGILDWINCVGSFATIGVAAGGAIGGAPGLVAGGPPGAVAGGTAGAIIGGGIGACLRTRFLQCCCTRFQSGATASRRPANKPRRSRRIDKSRWTTDGRGF